MGVQFKLKGRMMTALLDGEIDHHTAKDMREKIDYINLMDIAKINLSNCINDTMNLYKKQQTTERYTHLWYFQHRYLFIFFCR